MGEVRQELVVRRFACVALLVPAVLTAVTVGLIFAWRADVPSTVATHWGGDGSPDRFGSLATAYALSLVLGCGLPLIVAATTLPILRRGARGPNVRIMGSLAAGVSALAAALNMWTIAMQRGLADAQDGPNGWPAVAAGVGAGIAFGVGAWFFQPQQSTVVEGLQHGAPLDLGRGERVVWMRTVALGRPYAALLYAVVGGLGLGSVASLNAGDEAAAWVFLGASAFVALVVAATTSFHVKIDATGVSVVSALGVPRMRVAIADVADAGVAHVNGLAEFGGWGIRRRPSATGIIMRNGDALHITRHNGKRLVVTVDDAATAASLLMALAQRASDSPSSAASSTE